MEKLYPFSRAAVLKKNERLDFRKFLIILYL
jgi:hypothetical protein